MKTMIKKVENANLTTSIVMGLIGVILMFFPETTVNVISYIIGSIFLITGIIRMVYSGKNGDVIDRTSGFTLILFGVVIYVFGAHIVTIIRILIGMLLIYNGATKLILSLSLSKVSNTFGRVSSFLSLLMLLAGIILLFFIEGLSFTIGLILVIYSVLNIIQSLTYKKGKGNVHTDDGVVIIEEDENV